MYTIQIGTVRMILRYVILARDAAEPPGLILLPAACILSEDCVAQLKGHVANLRPHRTAMLEICDLMETLRYVIQARDAAEPPGLILRPDARILSEHCVAKLKGPVANLRPHRTVMLQMCDLIELPCCKFATSWQPLRCSKGETARC